MFKKYVFIILLFIFSSTQINAMIVDNIYNENIFTLPREIVDMIYDHLNKNDKKELLRVSTSFYDMTAKYLITMPELMDSYLSGHKTYNNILSSLMEKDWRAKRDIYNSIMLSDENIKYIDNPNSIFAFIVMSCLFNVKNILEPNFYAYKNVLNLRSSRQYYYKEMKNVIRECIVFLMNLCRRDLVIFNGFIDSDFYYNDYTKPLEGAINNLHDTKINKEEDIIMDLMSIVLLQVKEKYGKKALKKRQDREKIKLEVYIRSMILLSYLANNEEGRESFRSILVDFEKHIRENEFYMFSKEDIVELIAKIRKMSNHLYHTTWCDMLDSLVHKKSVDDAENLQE